MTASFGQFHIIQRNNLLIIFFQIMISSVLQALSLPYCLLSLIHSYQFLLLKHYGHSSFLPLGSVQDKSPVKLLDGLNMLLNTETFLCLCSTKPKYQISTLLYNYMKLYPHYLYLQLLQTKKKLQKLFLKIRQYFGKQSMFSFPSQAEALAQLNLCKANAQDGNITKIPLTVIFVSTGF